MKVSNDVEAKGTGVALGVGDARAELKVTDCEVLVAGRAVGQPDLRGGVAVAEDDGRETRNGVDGVGNAVRDALLARGKVGKGVVSDTGSTIGIDINLVAVLAEVRATKNGNSTTKGVTGENNAVGRVGLKTFANSTVSGGLDFSPGSSEAGMELAARYQIAVLLLEDHVGDEVTNVVAATDRNNNLTADIVNSDVGSNASGRTPKAQC